MFISFKSKYYKHLTSSYHSQRNPDKLSNKINSVGAVKFDLKNYRKVTIYGFKFINIQNESVRYDKDRYKSHDMAYSKINKLNHVDNIDNKFKIRNGYAF